MKIDIRNTYLIKTYLNEKQKIDSKKNNVDTKNCENLGSGWDVVQISRTSKDFLLASRGIQADEETRVRTLAEIRDAIRKGAYNISSEDVAEAILNRISGENRAKEN
jgi:anti-sigma28 factor (negative regulator of flagellin synthesis)